MPVFEEDGLVSGIFDTNQRKRAYAMFADFQGYDWVLPIHYYRDEVDLIALLQVKVIIPIWCVFFPALDIVSETPRSCFICMHNGKHLRTCMTDQCPDLLCLRIIVDGIVSSKACARIDVCFCLLTDRTGIPLCLEQCKIGRS